MRPRQQYTNTECRAICNNIISVQKLFQMLLLVPRLCTCVMPRAPMFSLYDVVPFPDPQAPAIRHPIPSIPIPLLIADVVGGGAPDSL